MRRDLLARLWMRWLAGVLSVFALAACESKDVKSVYEIPIAELPCAYGFPDDEMGGESGDFWASAPFPDAEGELDEGCEWLPFPGLSLLEIEHGLGRTPSQISIYISFAPNGESSTISSGDSGRIVGADERFVVVENFTEQRFYLRVEIR